VSIGNGATRAEALAASGIVTVTAESGASTVVTFTNGAKTVTKTFTSTGSPVAVVLTSADLTTLGDGTISISAVATDAAKNASTAGTTSFVLDTAAPASPTLALGTGVSDGANAAEALATSGVVTVIAETGSSTVVTFTRGTTTITKTVTGTGSAQAVTLTTADITALGDGTITVSAVATDAAGNVGAVTSNLYFTLNTTVSGKVVDGYVAGATVFADLNNNDAQDAGEPSAVTSATGGYSFSSKVSVANANLISLGGTDAQTGATVDKLVAPAGLSVITPVTTIYAVAVKAAIDAGSSATAAAATASNLLTNLGLTSTDLGDRKSVV
jgi:hypothetical protein